MVGKALRRGTAETKNEKFMLYSNKKFMLNSNKIYVLHPGKYATAHEPSGFGADYRILA